MNNNEDRAPLTEKVFGDALNQTLNQYGIQAARLSRITGATANTISHFRKNGRGETRTLVRLLEGVHAIDPDAYNAFWRILKKNFTRSNPGTGDPWQDQDCE